MFTVLAAFYSQDSAEGLLLFQFPRGLPVMTSELDMVSTARSVALESVWLLTLWTAASISPLLHL